MTFVYVTHDQFEALTVADQLVIMNHDGEIEQQGTPKEIYEFPASSFVAQFVGPTNIFEGNLQFQAEQPVVEITHLGKFLVDLSAIRVGMNSGSDVRMSVRPEKIFISPSKRTGFSNMLTGTVEAIVYYGRSTGYTVRLQNGSTIQVFEQNEEHFPHETIDYDARVYLYWQKENVVLLER
jgi:ABC-type Fe3+/spermidine/putrescine transport system ATPase subunit